MIINYILLILGFMSYKDYIKFSLFPQFNVIKLFFLFVLFLVCIFFQRRIADIKIWEKDNSKNITALLLSTTKMKLFSIFIASL